VATIRMLLKSFLRNPFYSACYACPMTGAKDRTKSVTNSVTG
jgi:hypothetical protein